MNQASVCEVNFTVVIFAHDPADIARCFGELRWNLKNSGNHVVDHRLSRPRQTPQQIATLSDNRFTRDQWRPEIRHSISATLVETVSGIKKSYNCAGVQQDRFTVQSPAGEPCWRRDRPGRTETCPALQSCAGRP